MKFFFLLTIFISIFFSYQILECQKIENIFSSDNYLIINKILVSNNNEYFVASTQKIKNSIVSFDIYNISNSEKISSYNEKGKQLIGFDFNNELLFLNDTIVNSQYILTKYNFINQKKSEILIDSFIHYSITQDGKYFIINKNDNKIKIYNISDGSVILDSSIDASSGIIQSMNISYDNKYISYCNTQGIQIRNFLTNELIQKIDKFSDKSSNSYFSKNGEILIFYSSIDHKIYFFTTKTGSALGSINWDISPNLGWNWFLRSFSYLNDSNKILINNKCLIDLQNLKYNLLINPGNLISIKVDNAQNFIYFDPYKVHLMDSLFLINKTFFEEYFCSGILNDDSGFFLTSLSSTFIDIYTFNFQDNIISKKHECRPQKLTDVFSVGYIRDYNQYFTAEIIDSSLNINIYDFDNNNLIESYSIPQVGNISNIYFLNGKDFLIYNNYIFDWKNKILLTRHIEDFTMLSPSGKFTYNIVKDSIYIINLDMNDTLKIKKLTGISYGSMMMANDGDMFLIFLSDISQKNHIQLYDFKSGNPIKIIYDSTPGIIFKSGIFFDRYLFFEYSQSKIHYIIYDLKNLSQVADLTSTMTVNLNDFSNDFRYSISMNFPNSYIFKNNIDPTGVTNPETSHLQTNNLNNLIFPNPATQTATIRFELSQPANISLKLTDMLGNQISLIDNQFMDSGSHSYEWDASSYPAGVYYYVLQTGSSVKTGKVLVIR
jgi:hypothetical protein